MLHLLQPCPNVRFFVVRNSLDRFIGIFCGFWVVVWECGGFRLFAFLVAGLLYSFKVSTKLNLPFGFTLLLEQLTLRYDIVVDHVLGHLAADLRTDPTKPT